jgi:sulfoxide reductase heme-binding subunit YedZ
MTPRFRTRLLRHHLPLALTMAVSTAAFYVSIDSPDAIFKLSLSSAYPAMALLAATLIVGAWRVVRGRVNPLSDDLTRDVGIWAATLTLVHVAFGLNVHMRGRMWLLFVPQDLAFPYVRVDTFGVANHTGLLATVLVLLLLATSNDASLRRLGAGRWKRLQRWNYAVFALTLVHGVLYQALENKPVFYLVLFTAVGASAVLLQAAGLVTRRRAQASEPSH